MSEAKARVREAGQLCTPSAIYPGVLVIAPALSRRRAIAGDAIQLSQMTVAWALACQRSTYRLPWRIVVANRRPTVERMADRDGIGSPSRLDPPAALAVDLEAIQQRGRGEQAQATDGGPGPRLGDMKEARVSSSRAAHLEAVVDHALSIRICSNGTDGWTLCLPSVLRKTMRGLPV